MTYRLIALFWLAVFYGIYFAKVLIQRRKGIVTNQIAKSKTHDKTYYVESVMKIATWLVLIVELVSIAFNWVHLSLIWRIFGIYLCLVGNVIFFISVRTMKDSWRAGVAKDIKRNLVTEGIYQYSRNPAFLGFDLVYAGILLMFFNPFLLLATLFAVVMLHLQILQEEEYLTERFGDEYKEYKAKAHRYAGFGKLTFDKVLLYIYFVLGIWSVLYFFTCLAYGGGPKLSWVWLWVLIAVFSFARVWMLKARIDGREKIKLPTVLKWIYRIVFTICLVIFVFVEGRIIGAMTATPKENLDYIIVLGAGLNGTEPSNPFKVRIEKAAQYLKANENTIVIASGGQGRHESISEAEAVRRKLTQQYGIDESRIILEEKSRDTEQNLKYSLGIIGDTRASVGIVTNGFHELRAMSIAQKVGYKNVHSVPGKTLMPVGIHYTVREFFGMVEYFIKYVI
ncbi:ElyC/SanA/YdcF family protein [Butyrivibrio sp. VCB2006]|uniref:ElyC/SanA/YdcF family protein n=1 Tax=Butyrivibrio sp. VCB2006 TaxID=1280679 RepID=UPI0004296952|nr:ElyC/SanA/YdcF family protein [Butyrivibrio sp. VCB2006]